MTMPAKLLLAAAIPSSLALTACGEHLRLSPLPADLTQCSAEPEAPALPGQDWSSVDTARAAQFIRDTMTLDYILALRSAGGDCRAKVKGAKAWNDSVGAHR